MATATTEAAATAANKDKHDDDDPATGRIISKIKHIIDSISSAAARRLIMLFFSLITRSKLIRAFRLGRRFFSFGCRLRYSMQPRSPGLLVNKPSIRTTFLLRSIWE